MLFYRLVLIRFFSMLAFLTVSACTAGAARPNPGDLLNPDATGSVSTPTDPLATFWLPTPTGGTALPGAATPAPAQAATAIPGSAPATLPPAGAPASTPGIPAGAGLSADVQPLVDQARVWLGQQLRTVESNVVLQNVERVQWPDTCLGIGQPGQGCAQVVTPGYRIIFYANGQNYEVRVDDAGRVLRMLEGGKG